MDEVNPKPKTRLMPNHLLYLTFILMFSLHVVFPGLHIIETPWNLFGFVLILPGLWLIASSHKLFLDYQTTIRPDDKPDALITEGPYKLSRNPMYLAGIFVLMSLSTILGTLTPWIGVFFFYAVMSFYFIPMEEEMLRSEFGEKFIEYKNRVRRWL